MIYLALPMADVANVKAGVGFYCEKVKNSLIRQTRATFLDGSRISLDPAAKTPINGLSRRKELAERIIEHPNFPRAVLNGMLAHFMGKVFTHPFDTFN